MTAFAFACAVLLAAILVWTTLPLWRGKPATAVADAPASKGDRRWSIALVALAVPSLAVGMYYKLSNWDWEEGRAHSAEQMNVEEMLSKLEKKLATNPDNAPGWIMLGRSYVELERYPRAVEAYQRAYDLTKGENVEALTGLGEALAYVDRASLAGRAGQLFDAALTKDPNDTKALWYGGMAALETSRLPEARDRFTTLLKDDNLPPNIREMLEKQVQALNGALGEASSVAPNGPGAGPTVPPNAPAGPIATPRAEAATGGQKQRSITVSIKMSPEIQKQVTAPLRLFVLARDPAGGGPPLAVKRLSSEQLPMTVTLTESDAMMPTRTIANAQRVTIVARLSRSGMPQAQSGDFFGESTYEFGKNTGTVQITIDQRVP